MIKVGSLFSGIGGFEKGIEDAFGGMAETVWQVEQNSFCQKVLKKHWPNATIFDDVRTVGKHNLEPVHILCGGFPCQSISVAGKMEGLENENKSGLWWEMHRIISELRPRIAILENVANVLRVGGPDVVGSLAQIGYDCEWTIVRASDFGFLHRRARWFCIAYSHSTTKTKPRKKKKSNRTCPKESAFVHTKAGKWQENKQRKNFHHNGCNLAQNVSTNTNTPCKQQSTHTQCLEQKQRPRRTICQGFWNNERTSNLRRFPTESPVCRRTDGIPYRMDRCAALGNAIVPQCSEWVARQVLNSGLLDDLLEEK